MGFPKGSCAMLYILPRDIFNDFTHGGAVAYVVLLLHGGATQISPPDWLQLIIWPALLVGQFDGGSKCF